MTSSQRIFTLEDVAEHASSASAWVVHDNKIYNITPFLLDHPGGSDILLSQAGQDITTIMASPDVHAHTKPAYEMLKSFQVGVLGAEEHLLDPNFVYDEEHFAPSTTETEDDFKRNHFLDLEQPLVMQVLRSNFSKTFYLKQVHEPRHISHTARMFGPDYLEWLTKTPFWVVPMVWLPIAGYLFGLSLWQHIGVAREVAFVQSIAFWLLGVFIWTLLEYGVHRFVFHIERFLPDHPFFLMLHFTAHGVHHYLPMDHLRLVMPPALFAILEYPFTRLVYALLPRWVANAGISGAFMAYVGYDMCHYSLHYAKLPAHIRKLKSHHMNHHYLEPNLGFGITSQLWDHVFGTDFIEMPATRAAKKL